MTAAPMSNGTTWGRLIFLKGAESHPNTECVELVGNTKLAFRSAARKVPHLMLLDICTR